MRRRRIQTRVLLACDGCGGPVPEDETICPACKHRGWVTIYTTAEPAYDWFGTHTVRVAGQDGRGRDVRQVLADPRYVESQRDRYASGCHLEVDQTGGLELRVLCRKVKLDNICDSGASDSAAPATCPVCAKRDPRVAR